METNVIQDEFLSELTVKGHGVALVMSTDKVAYYSSDIKTDDISVEIVATPAEGKWTCEGDLGTVALRRGVNTFRIQVKDGGTLLREYCLSVIQNHITSDASLKRLLVSGEEAKAEYSGEKVDHYYYCAKEDITQVEIDAVPSIPDAEVSGDLGWQVLEYGINTFVVEVCSADGKELERYHLVVEREGVEEGGIFGSEAVDAKDSDASAPDHTALWGKLRTSFDTLIDELEESMEPQAVLGEVAVAIADRDETPPAADRDEAAESDSVFLERGEPTTKEEPTPQDEPMTQEAPAIQEEPMTQKEPAPTVEALPQAEDKLPGLKSLLAFALLRQAASAEAFLGKVSQEAELDYEAYLDSCKGEQTAFLPPLQPAFSPEQHEYDLYLGDDVGSLYISAHGAQGNWKVKGDLGYHKLEGDTARFVVEVYDEAEHAKTSYALTVHIQRTTMDTSVMEAALQQVQEAAIEAQAQQSAECALSELTVSGGVLSPRFSPRITRYKVTLTEKTNRVTISAKPVDSMAAVMGDIGEKQLVKGKNMFSVIGVAEDQRHRSVYTLMIKCKGLPKTKEPTPKPSREEKAAKAPKPSNTEKAKKNTEKAVKQPKKKEQTEGAHQKLFAGLDSRIKKLFPPRARPAMRPKLKLRTQLFAIILVSAGAGYLAFTYFAQPTAQENARLQQVAGETMRLRAEVEARLAGRAETEAKIVEYQQQIQEFSNQYPLIPSQEEILNYLEQLRTKVSFDYTIVAVGQSAILSTDELMSNLVQKGLADLFQENLDSLTPPSLTGEAAPLEGEQVTDAEGNPQTVPQHFDKNAVVLDLRGSKENLLRVCQEIYQNERILVLEEPGLTQYVAQGGYFADGTMEWGVQLSILYYHYTGEQMLQSNGLWELAGP